MRATDRPTVQAVPELPKGTPDAGREASALCDADGGVLAPVLPLRQDTAVARRAYCRTEPDRRGLGHAEIEKPNVSLAQAIRCGLIAARTIEGMRERIARLPELDHTSIARLEDYVWALVYADSACVMEREPRKHGRALRREAKALRRRLVLQAELLAELEPGLVRPDANLRTTRSSVELAQDLVTLPRLLRAFKSRAARAVVDASELVRAEELSAALLHYVAARDQVSVPRRALIEERRRAFTLFARAYDQTRRAISFLRYDEGDADVLVPLLYKKR